MRRWIIVTLTYAFAVVFPSCKPVSSGMSTVLEYDEKTGHSILNLPNYVKLNIPGKWKEVSYDAESTQHFLESSDRRTFLAVAINPKERYSFNRPSYTDAQFLDEFYKWDAEHFSKEGATTAILNAASDKNYILWEANIKAEGIHQIYLYGIKHNIVYNLRGSSKTWNDQQIKDLLIGVFTK